MKRLAQTLGVVAIGLVSFSFTTRNEVPVSTSSYTQKYVAEDEPKVVILDIVDNIAAEGTNIATDFKNKIETLNKENVQVVLWKDLTKGLQEAEKQSIIDSLKPELIMTLSFENSDDNTNKVAAVVSKQNVAFERTFEAAREFADNINSTTIKNDGVYQTDSKYIQDNAAPSIFLSLKVKNDAASNAEIVNKIASFIETAEIPDATMTPTMQVDSTAVISEAAVDTVK